MEVFLELETEETPLCADLAARDFSLGGELDDGGPGGLKVEHRFVEG
jgi:hypothetical protein